MVSPATLLTPAELRARAARITVVLTDCDGVLTDGGVYYGPGGEALLRFNRRDGLGVERLRQAGLASAIVTREASPLVELRAAKLEVRLFSGVKDKLHLLPVILDELEATAEGVAYIGDDLNDLPLLQEVAKHGLTAAPADAAAPLKPAVHLVTQALGGQGAFREFSEWILSLKGASV